MMNLLSEHLLMFWKRTFFIVVIYERPDNSTCQYSITCISSGIDGTGVDKYSGATLSIFASLLINSGFGVWE